MLHGIVVARPLGQRPFAATAAIVVEHRCLGRGKGKVELQIPRGPSRGKLRRRSGRDASRAARSGWASSSCVSRDPEALRGDALVVDQPAPGQVGHGRVDEDDLPRREGARVGGIGSWAQAVEGNLKPDWPAVGGPEPAIAAYRAEWTKRPRPHLGKPVRALCGPSALCSGQL